MMRARREAGKKGGSGPPRRGLAGITLMEMIVTLTILGVLAVPITLNFAASSRLGGESARLDQAVLTLRKIADWSSRFSGTQGANSFSQVMLVGGTNPGRLSYLTRKVITGDVNACGGAFLTPANWRGPFYNRIIPPTGLKIAEGFFADDTLSRYNAAGVVEKVPAGFTNTNTVVPGTLAIVMRNVTRTDALGLRTRIEGTSTATTGTVRFATTGDPVTVYYHFNIHGC